MIGQVKKIFFKNFLVCPKLNLFLLAGFINGYQPTLRFELFREGVEDYEYLFIANGNQYPNWNGPSVLDPMVSSVAPTLKTWTQNADAVALLRQKLGLYIEGTSNIVPTLQATCGSNVLPSKPYYINFQDPSMS